VTTAISDHRGDIAGFLAREKRARPGRKEPGY
jgi:hypothetical protein